MVWTRDRQPEAQSLPRLLELVVVAVVAAAALAVVFVVYAAAPARPHRSTRSPRCALLPTLSSLLVLFVSPPSRPTSPSASLSILIPTGLTPAASLLRATEPPALRVCPHDADALAPSPSSEALEEFFSILRPAIPSLWPQQHSPTLRPRVYNLPSLHDRALSLSGGPLADCFENVLNDDARTPSKLPRLRTPANERDDENAETVDVPTSLFSFGPKGVSFSPAAVCPYREAVLTAIPAPPLPPDPHSFGID
ncbi:hypothetical protein K488DRAFT_82769 [Vararia minispora EC-137]|uniref:Uncharacterized protein n=1 Tax=Vararia minispora EC-137 TaxID=1314806 RepID=A0ACB8QVP7_9AGAM|nr:hypothetical protein K488DRAFT_82769 [Vararia minispora EC-137]